MTGTLAPKYYVLSVIYAPPGTAGGGSSSLVEYSNGSTTGTTTNVSSSFNTGIAVSLEATVGIKDVASASFGAGFTINRSKTNSQSVDISKDDKTILSRRGPDTDGIDHNDDIFVLWLNPKVAVTATKNSAAWKFEGNGIAEVLYVSVKDLKNPTNMSDINIAARLAQRGLTTADFQEIPKLDPFAFGNANIDDSRFIPIRTSIPYSKYSVTTARSISSSTVTSVAGSATQSFKVDLSTQINPPLVTKILSASLKKSDSWEWTNTSGSASNNGVAEVASLTIGAPSSKYAGPVTLLVYYDTLYKTFLFELTTKLFRLHGTIIGEDGKPVAGQEVAATAGGKTYLTYSDAEGRYGFVENLDGAVQVRNGKAVMDLPLASPNASVELRATRMESPTPQIVPDTDRKIRTE